MKHRLQNTQQFRKCADMNLVLQNRIVENTRLTTIIDYYPTTVVLFAVDCAIIVLAFKYIDTSLSNGYIIDFR